MPRSRWFAKYHLRYLDEHEAHHIDILAGAYMFCRTSLLKSVGGFDEDFFMYGEDIDLSYRIVKAGYDNWYLPVDMIHYKGESTKKTRCATCACSMRQCLYSTASTFRATVPCSIP